MELFQHLKTILRHPSILRPYKRIILLSHMRANTSLLGHVLGSNPQIEGYYELHIGYYSWKSFIRQKLKYFSEHSPKKNATYMFDKVLHNEHYVNPDVFSSDDIVIIMVRDPISTIKSIQKLFLKVDPSHENTNPENARAYYISRLEQLINLAKKLQGQYYFLNADDLTQSPDSILDFLTKKLELKTPLSKKYNLFKNTGVKGTGDSSENMVKGEIQAKMLTPVNYADVDTELGQIYQKAIEQLSNLSLNTSN
jgi:hypothetical protein